MPGKHFDLDTNKTLGGSNASDITIASQKAVKGYVDDEISKVSLTQGDNITINKGVISAVDTDQLSALKDVTITTLKDGQGLAYDSTNKVWINVDLAQDTVWGNITGTLADQSDLKTALDNKANNSDLAKVAKSGSYNDLNNKPTIPTVTDTYSATGTDAVSGKAVASAISGKANDSDLAAVAKSGSYNDLENKPAIPTVVDTYSATGTDAVSGKAVASAISNKADKGTTLASYGITDTYTKDQIDGKMTSVYVFQGSVATKADLPKTSTKGFVYNVEEDGMNYAWDGSKWDALGATLDLSGYVLKVDADKAYAAASHKHAIADITGLQTALDSKLEEDDLEGYALKSEIPTNYVPNTRTVNGKALSSNISLGASDVGATTLSEVNSQGFLKAADIEGKADKDELSTVATSGSYNDLSDKPTIPTITDTYSATSSNGMSGKAVASAISNKADKGDIPTDYVPNTRKVNGKALSSDITLSASDVSAVPTSRKVNNKALSSDITLTAGDVGATTMAEVEAKGYLTEHQSLDNYYNKTEIDGKLSGAMHFKGTVDKVADLPSGATVGDMYNVKSTGANYAWDGTAWDKLSENIDLSGVVPTSRKVNGKALSSDITLSASDVGAATMSEVEAKNYLVAADIEGKANDADLKAVAKSGSYNDLTDKPTIPTITDTYSSTSSDGMSGKAVANAISGKANSADLGAVATSNSYTDLDNKPTIPTVDATLSGTSTNAIQNKAVKSALDGKQATISDLATIRSNAEAGKGASDTISGYGDIVTHNASEFLTEHQAVDSALSSTSENPVQNKVINSALSGKQATISDLGTIRSNASAGKSAKDTIDTYGDIVTHNASEFLTEHNPVDAALSDTSANAVQNKVVKAAIDGKANATHSHTASEVSGLATVATTGSYTSLSNKPSIPTITDTYSATSGNGMSGKAVASAISGKANSSDLKAVATSGSYNDLTDKPSIPAVVDTYSATGTDAVSGKAVASAISGKADTSSLKAVATSGSYNDLTDKPSIPTIVDTYSSTSSNGMSGKAVASAISGKADASSLKAVATSGSYTDLTNKPSIPTVDTTLSGTSTNAIQNKAVKEALDGKANSVHSHGASEVSGLAAVATSGSYTDLSDKPSIPTITDTYSATSGNGMSGKAVASAISGKANTADLKKIATSGSYNDLTDKPTIPSIEGLQPELTPAQQTAVDSGISSTKVGSYDTHIADTTKHITAAERTAWNGKADASNVYTKTEVDSKLSSVYKYKGSVANYSALPTSGQVAGDVYNVEAADSTHGIKAGDNVAWTGSAWDVLSGLQDLSAYAKSADLKTVATTGSYDDLTNKPTIPSAVTESTVSGWGFTKNTGTYSKPSTGIPKTDLASAVQTSLDKADTALQGITSSDVTTALGFTPYNATNPNGYTSNKGTITGATMNGASVTATNGVLALGTVITAHQDISGKANISDLADVATSGSYNDLSDKPTIPTAVTETTVSGWGFTKNAGTVTKVNNISPVNGNVTLSIPTVTDTYSATSSNAMSGKAVASAISGLATTASLSAVATSGSYNDLTDKPSIPTVTDTYSATSTSAMSGKAVASAISNKMDKVTLATVATSGSYNDLSDKPSIPSAVTETTVSGWGFTKNAGTVTTVNNVAPVNGNVTLSIPSAVTETTVSGWGFTKNTGTYSKPSTGIPKTDLASAVQTSLGKADTALQSHQDISGKANTADLATVATSGSYNDLTNKPTIPTAVTETTVSGWGFTKNAGTLTGVKMNGSAKTVTNGVVDLGTVITAHQDISGKADKTSLATVATSGSYSDLSNKPTIPTVNNATLTIQKNGTNVATFTANASSNVTANISVPTVTDTYSSTSTNAMSGKAVASAIANAPGLGGAIKVSQLCG